MNDPIKNGYINWIDGMKISKDHFIDMQKATEDRVRDVRSIVANGLQFGLIPGKINGREALEYNLLLEHPNRVRFELYQCRAISPAGDRVEMVSKLNSQSVLLKKEFEIDIDKENDRVTYDIILKVNSFEMDPYGEPNVEESPPRHPFAQPTYSLEIAPSKEIKYNEHNRNYVILTRLEVYNSEISHLKEYIPPCLTVESAPELEEFYFKYLKFLKSMEQNVFRIIIKLNGTEQKTKLASNVETMCRRILDLLEREMDSYTTMYRRSNPLVLVTHVMRFARNMRNSLEIMTNVGKDELLLYVQEVIDMSPGEYMKIHTDIMSIDYDQYDINESLVKILSFCRVNGKLFDEWSRLDYIGKKKNSEIYVAEKPMDESVEAAKPKRKWDF